MTTGVLAPKLSAMWMHLAAITLCLGLAACGDDPSTGADSGTVSGCRFSQPACLSCAAEKCNDEASACYGSDWSRAMLCTDSGASAACTEGGSTDESRMLQSAYARCMLGCVSACQ